jgi:hypothetical protein
MNRKKENISLLMGKVAMICFFLFVNFSFRSSDCSGNKSFCQRTPIVHVFNADKSAISDHSAILVSSRFLSTFYNSFVPTEILALNTCNKIYLKIICSANKVDQLLKICKAKFIVIKPQIIDIGAFHNRTSLNNDEVSSIS